MNEEILNRLASLETRVSNLEVKLMDTNKSNPGLLHEEVIKFLQTFGSELNRMYGAYGPNQMAMNIQPGGMFQQPIYGSSPNGNATMYKPNCRFSGNGSITTINHLLILITLILVLNLVIVQQMLLKSNKRYKKNKL